MSPLQPSWALVAGLLVLTSAIGADAAVFVWDGGGADNLFSTGANWNPDVPSFTSVNGHSIRFGPLAPGGHTTADVDVGGNPDSFVFNAGAAPMTITASGNAMQFATGNATPIANNSTNPQTFDTNVRVFWIGGAANRNWNANTGDLNFSTVQWRGDSRVSDTLTWTLTGGANGLISGNVTNVNVPTGATVDLVKSGAGTWTINGSLPSGPVARNVTVQAGTLVLGSANNYGGATAVSNGGTLRLDNVNAIQGTSGVTVANGGQLWGRTTGTYAAVPVTITGNGANSRGALHFGTGGNGTWTWQGPITLNGNARIGTYGVTQNVNLEGAILGTGNLDLWGGGGGVAHTTTYTLSAPGNYHGNTTINAAFGSSTGVRLSGGDNRLPIGTVLSLNPTWNAGIYAELVLDGNSQQLAGLTNTGAGTARVRNGSATGATLTINNAADHTFSGILGGPDANDNNFALAKTGAGTLTLSGANTYTGATTISDGTLRVGSIGTTNPVTIANHGFETPAVGNFVYNPTGADWTFNTASGVARSTFFVNAPPEGVQAGFLQGGGANIAQTINIAEDGYYQINFQAQGRGGASGPNGIILHVDGEAIGTWAHTDVSQSQWLSYSAPVYLTAGSHTLAFLGNNTAGGDRSTSIDNVQMAQPIGSLPTNTAVNLTASGATLDLNYTYQTIGSLAGVAGSNVINGNLTAGGADTSTTFAGVFSGAGGLTKTGAGTLTLAGANTYTGATTVEAGTLLINGALTGTSAVTVGGGSTIYFDDVSGSTSDNLHGTQPVIGTGAWTASNLWKADGEKQVSGNANAFLPFTPEEGYIYSLSMDMDVTVDNWIALGYTDGAEVGLAFQNPANAPVGWILLRPDRGEGRMASHLGPGVGGTEHLFAPDGTVRLEVQLDTTGPDWSMEWFANGDSLRGPVSFGSNPIINHVGFGAFNNAQGTVGNFQLDILHGLPTAVLGGTGAIHADTTIGRFGVLSPGDGGIGKLEFAGGARLTLEPGAAIDWEFRSATKDGETYDYDHIAGDALYLPDGEGAIGLNIFGLDGYRLSPGDRFTLFSGDVYHASTETLFDPGQDITHVFNITDDIGWGMWKVTAGSLVLTAVPEPGTWLLLLSALAGGLLVRRRSE